ncbi:alpha/beta hydrolase family protein [Amycolatopsis thermoflava]|uniref:alpha/beta hydrolase family protein n=1 Tax=Amycolatopsis thermoflava TaxID=84480 RepID=UPI003656F0F7
MKLWTADGLTLDARRHPGDGPVVVLAHGITGDLTENGLFDVLTDRLTGHGFEVLRFSFRGHGASAGRPRDMTIAGERLDLRAAVDWAAARGRGVAVVASSFGAVSTTLSLPELGDRLSGVVLWQPVLDLRATFLEPSLPRGRALYGDRSSLRDNGFLDIEGRFELGAELFEEFARLDPRAAFLTSTVPALVLHGDADEHVPYEVARDAALARDHTTWCTISGAGHGFREAAGEVLDRTVDWLVAYCGER